VPDVSNVAAYINKTTINEMMPLKREIPIPTAAAHLPVLYQHQRPVAVPAIASVGRSQTPFRYTSPTLTRQKIPIKQFANPIVSEDIAPSGVGARLGGAGE